MNFAAAMLLAFAAAVWPGDRWSDERWPGEGTNVAWPNEDLPWTVILETDFDDTSTACDDGLSNLSDGACVEAGSAVTDNACDYSGVDYFEGVESVFLSGLTNNWVVAGTIECRNAFTAITSGVVTADFSLKVTGFSAAVNPTVFRFLDSSNTVGCRLALRSEAGPTEGVFRVTSPDATSSDSVATWVVDEQYLIRMTYDIDNDVCSLFVDQANGSYGNGSFATASVDAAAPATNVAGLDLNMNQTTDVILDQLGVCKGSVPAGRKCAAERPPIRPFYTLSFDGDGTGFCNAAAENLASTPWNETSTNADQECDCIAGINAACPLLGTQSLIVPDTDGSLGAVAWTDRWSNPSSSVFTMDFLLRPVADTVGEDDALTETIRGTESGGGAEGFYFRFNPDVGDTDDNVNGQFRLDLACQNNGAVYHDSDDLTVTWSAVQTYLVRIVWDSANLKGKIDIDPSTGTIGAGTLLDSFCDNADPAASSPPGDDIFEPIRGMTIQLSGTQGTLIFDDFSMCEGRLPDGQRCRQQSGE